MTLHILRVCADEFLVTDGKEVFRIMSRDKIRILSRDTKLEVEEAGLWNIHRELCKDCPDRPVWLSSQWASAAISYTICENCPREVERR